MKTRLPVSSSGPSQPLHSLEQLLPAAPCQQELGAENGPSRSRRRDKAGVLGRHTSEFQRAF